MPLLFTGSAVVTLGDPPTMIPAISGLIQFYEVAFIFVCCLLFSWPCLSRIAYVPASCFIYSLIILFVSVSWQILSFNWSTCLWSAVAAISRLSIADTMSSVGTTSFSIWYTVYLALNFWASLRLWYLSMKKWLNTTYVCLFVEFSLHSL